MKKEEEQKYTYKHLNVDKTDTLQNRETKEKIRIERLQWKRKILKSELRTSYI